MSREVASVRGRLVLDDRIEPGRIAIEDGWIAEIELVEPVDGGAGRTTGAPATEELPYIAPGFVDVHVHGGGGHDAMGGADALDGMARHLLRRGVTGFLPTAVTAPLPALATFAETVRAWLPGAPVDGAEPLGFNLEGPFLAEARRGAHDPASLRAPADVDRRDLEPLLEGLRLITIAPELPGALELIGWLRERGVATSMGHSASTVDEAQAGYAAGGRSTTHLFNAMSGIDHRAPGLAVAALLDDTAYVELIADGIHVHPALWPLILRLKPADRLLLVSDAITLAGMGDGRATIGGLDVEVVGQRVTLVGHDDARRLGHRPRRRCAEPGRVGGRAAGGCRGREPEPTRAARHLGSRAAGRRTARRPRRARRRSPGAPGHAGRAVGARHGGLSGAAAAPPRDPAVPR